MSSKSGSRLFLKEVRGTIQRHHMIPERTGVLAAVSGGPDSVAMLHALCELSMEMNFRVVVAHLDHALREEAAGDAEFVCNLAEELGLEWRCRRVDVRGKARSEGISIEEAGRLLRYEFLEEIRRSVSVPVIASGHHRDDALETFFLRLFRGSSVEGLCGIPAVRGNIVRPLMGVSRQQIMAFLEENRIPYRVDSSNFDSSVDRNFVRNQLFPFIEDRFPSFRKPMARTMKVIETEDHFLEGTSEEFYASAVSLQGREMVLNRKQLCEFPEAIARRVVMKALHCFTGPGTRYTQSHLDLIFSVVFNVRPSGHVHLPRGLTIQRNYDQIRLTRGIEDATRQPFVISVQYPGLVSIPDSDFRFRFRMLSPDLESIDFGTKDAVYYDADELSFPVTLRSPRPGDRFRPWGMKGKRKLKKVLVDAKVPLHERAGLPLVEKDGEIVWVPFVRRGFQAPVGSHTRQILEIAVHRETRSADESELGKEGHVL
ncbi:MAG: tRNA(Ile)-lysidine synthase [Thermodesulfobacteriota bacterium]|nr:tRNA(Ile)-lysidine synthase [Thermodesulfobacteriota bacterium]